RALASETGLPRSSRSAASLLGFLMPAEVSRSLMSPSLWLGGASRELARVIRRALVAPEFYHPRARPWPTAGPHPALWAVPLGAQGGRRSGGRYSPASRSRTAPRGQHLPTASARGRGRPNGARPTMLWPDAGRSAYVGTPCATPT